MSNNLIFVFGSNLQGIHGAGAAKHAAQHYGAVRGQGEGLQGRSYALPTKATPYQTLAIEELWDSIETFLTFASSRPDLNFFVTKVGCGLAGFPEPIVISGFREGNVKVPENVWLPEGW